MAQKTVTIAAPAADESLARRLSADLHAAGYTVADTVTSSANAVLILLRPAAIQNDTALNQTLMTALEAEQHVIPLTLDDAPLPRIISNLQPLDFGGETYPLLDLTTRIDYLQSTEAPRPLTVLTPKTRARNRKLGLLIGIPALLLFIAGVVLVGTGLIRPPSEEYILVETQRVETRNAMINPTLDAFLPRSTADAVNFESTVQAMPTRLQPFLAATATARVE